jgi:hypothetical protein
MHHFQQKRPLLYTILSHFHPQNAITLAPSQCLLGLRSMFCKKFSYQICYHHIPCSLPPLHYTLQTFRCGISISHTNKVISLLNVKSSQENVTCDRNRCLFPLITFRSLIGMLTCEKPWKFSKWTVNSFVRYNTIKKTYFLTRCYLLSAVKVKGHEMTCWCVGQQGNTTDVQLLAD